MKKNIFTFLFWVFILFIAFLATWDYLEKRLIYSECPTFSGWVYYSLELCAFTFGAAAVIGELNFEKTQSNKALSENKAAQNQASNPWIAASRAWGFMSGHLLD